MQAFQPPATMLRRSSRLLISGYYCSDEEDSTNVRNVFYQESYTGRIFKKRVGSKRCRYTLSQASSSYNPFHTEGPAITEGYSAQSLHCFSSGHYLEKKNDLPESLTMTELHKHSSSSHFCGLLTGFMYFLMDVLMLSRNTCHLRKPVLTAVVLTFLLTLAFGLWIYPSILSNVSTPIKMIQTPSCTTAKREIAVLKEDRLKQTHMLEMLKSELSVLKSTISNVDQNLRFWIEQQSAGAETQISELKTELFAWLQQQLARVSGSRDTAVQHAELQEALKALERRLMILFKLVRAKEWEELWKSVRESTSVPSMQDVHDTVRRALHVFRADDVGMLDYALESIGSTIIKSRCSDTYHAKSAYLSLFGIPLFYYSESPRTIIQPEVYAGKCWPFKGDQGFATIRLSYPVRITHVTLQHLPKELHPHRHISNAPREFSVYGMNQSDEEGALLGSFLYDYNGEAIQTFKLPESMKDVYSVVQLRVMSNWGHPDYTCIYRFRVHGQLRTL